MDGDILWAIYRTKSFDNGVVFLKSNSTSTKIIKFFEKEEKFFLVELDNRASFLLLFRQTKNQ